MFRIRTGENQEILLEGRFDASEVEAARGFFSRISESRVLDLSALEYISSGGLGLLLATEKRLRRKGHGLKITNLHPHLRELFIYAGLDDVFDLD